MVLQEISEPDSGFSSYDDPSSESSTQRTPRLTLDTSQLPQPPPFSWLLGHRQQQFNDKIAKSLQNAATLIHRPLSQDEAQAMAYQVARIERATAWGDMIGTGVGFALFNRTRPTPEKPGLKFPFMPRVQVQLDKLGPLKGTGAVFAWTMLRGSAYVLVFSGGMGFIAYGATAILASSELSSDKRLQEINEALRGVRQRAKGGLEGMYPPKAGQQQQGQQMQGMGQAVEGRGWRGSKDDEDNMSPQSGGSFTDTGVLSDAQMRVRDRTQRAEPSETPRQADRENTFSMDKVTRQPRNFDDSTDWDDASPAAGGASSTPGESAWDRLRRQNASGASNGGSPAQGWADRRAASASAANGGADSFSFDRGDEERQLAKTEAQKEFDARIDRERQGKDFDDRGGRWR